MFCGKHLLVLGELRLQLREDGIRCGVKELLQFPLLLRILDFEALYVILVLLLADENVIVDTLGKRSFNFVHQPYRKPTSLGDVAIRVVDVIVKLRDQ